MTHAEFSANLVAKLEHPGFVEDCTPLLKPGVVFDPPADAGLVLERLLLPLDPRNEIAVATESEMNKARPTP